MKNLDFILILIMMMGSQSKNVSKSKFIRSSLELERKINQIWNRNTNQKKLIIIIIIVKLTSIDGERKGKKKLITNICSTGTTK
ncbi:hypothetical protein BpHYR1_025964 [Brachionus plicatilis]|uniref:Secreted protein n=1 Tax=Brachionus plicatilis TaxID=10195 RepID=A0A3M7SMI6_BRAPC|nr:hypothetical protein BpHYR1_025964 [Brachionus plicatilis]